jgi:MazG family protein
VSPHHKTARRPRGKGRAKLRGRSRKAVRDRESGRDAHVGGSANSPGEWFEKLVALQARLRAPGGCPWDREQTHESLRRFLAEETYEVLDAMENGTPREFAGELGDLLLQVVFHSVLAEEAGRFTVADVIESIHAKMVRRHPHVFGDVKAATSGEVLKNWEQIKAEERTAAGKPARKKDADDSILGGIPRSLPAALEAYQLTRRAAHIGFDWDNLEGIFEKLDEEKRELLEIRPNGEDSKAIATVGAGNQRRKSGGASSSTAHARIEEEAGDLLFAAVNVARFLGVDPEIALKKANRKFRQRFNFMESAAQRENRRLADLPRERMEELWNDAKMAKSAKAKDIPNGR